MLLDTGFTSAPATQKASLRHEANALAEHFYFYRKPLAVHQICGAVVAAVSAAAYLREISSADGSSISQHASRE